MRSDLSLLEFMDGRIKMEIGVNKRFIQTLVVKCEERGVFKLNN